MPILVQPIPNGMGWDSAASKLYAFEQIISTLSNLTFVIWKMGLILFPYKGIMKIKCNNVQKCLAYSRLVILKS